MSQMDNKVEKKSGFIDAQYSSGDCNNTSNNNKCKQKIQEENNNEIDELSKDLSEMGNVVESIKRPPNICVETCVFESDSEATDKECNQENGEDSADNYADDFEEESEEELKIEPKSAKSETTNMTKPESPNIKLSKSHSFVSSKANMLSRSTSNTSHYGSLPVPTTRRVNMSFTNERLREIERHNHILLKKILTARNVRKSSIPPAKPTGQLPAPTPAAAIKRKRQQRQIDYENMILLKKIQRAKSSSCSMRH